MEIKNKIISVLGSTGSIGTQSLDVARSLGLTVSALSANSNIELLEKQIREFSPKIAAVYDEQKAKELQIAVADTNTKIVGGMNGLCEVATEQSATMVITSVVGMIGLLPTLEAIKAKKHIGLANKETLVTAGQLVMRAARENNVNIIPVDSEHSAIFQCLQGCNDTKKELKRILLTASGGPFFGKSLCELKDVTPELAIKHPNWAMGAKISVDSATLMNKGLEFIEAFWLFDVLPHQIEVIIHRESVIHSMVEYSDNSCIAQLGTPDMRLPIQYAITYPNRLPSPAEQLDLLKYGNLTFKAPDLKTFRCLSLCMEAIKKGGTLPVAVNAANEEAVSLFLAKKLSFIGLFDIIELVVNEHKIIYAPTLEDILETEKWTREFVRRKVLINS